MDVSKKLQKRIRRHQRVRSCVQGTARRPRLSVFRSNKHIWAQLIDDGAGKTMLSVGDKNSVPKGKSKTRKTVIAEKVGAMIAKKAQEKKIYTVVFDRGGYKYHGIVQAVAEGARRAGLKF